MLYVHAGKFHADDVFCVAFLDEVIGLTMNWKRIARVTPEMVAECENGTSIIADIGRVYNPVNLQFDHHQNDCPTWDGEHKHCAFSELVEYFAEKRQFPDWYMPISAFSHKVAMADNGEEFFEIASIVSAFNTTWDEDESSESQDAQFSAAVEFARAYLRNMLRQYRSKEHAKREIKANSRISGNVLVLSKFINWQETVCTDSAYKDITACVWPDSVRGGYLCQIRPVAPDSFDRVGDFHGPAVGIYGCTFIHNSGFLASFDTEQHAIWAGQTVFDDNIPF